jgi:hypothetical protein
MLHAKIKQLEKEGNVSSRLRAKIDAISSHYTRIPPSSFYHQDAETVDEADGRSRAMTLPVPQQISQAQPHSEIRRSKSDYFRDSVHEPPLPKATPKKPLPYTIEAEIDDVDAMISRLALDAHSLVENEGSESERMRLAKLQVEYDVWCGGKEIQ